MRELQRVVPFLVRGPGRGQPAGRLQLQAVPTAGRQGTEGLGAGTAPEQNQDERVHVPNGKRGGGWGGTHRAGIVVATPDRNTLGSGVL